MSLQRKPILKLHFKKRIFKVFTKRKNEQVQFHLIETFCDLVPFVEFKKREKYPWSSVTFSKVAL